MEYLTSNKVKNYRNENRPDYCPISGVTMTNPVLDHCHDSGLVRGVIDSEINAFMGRCENAYKRLSCPVRQKPLPDMLRDMADFIEKARDNVLHPVGARDLIKRFNCNSKDWQIAKLQELVSLGRISEDVDLLACKNSKERTDLYASAIKSVKWKPSK